MKIGILGSGNVGQALAKGFLLIGDNEVYLATRESDGEKARQLKIDFPDAQICDFKTAAASCELAVLCTPWPTARDALKLAEAERTLKGKVLVDTNNPLDRQEGGVKLASGLEGSAAEMVQGWLPDVRVVKCWNSTGAVNFYKPDFESLPTMFLCGNDAVAKEQVSEFVEAFGWEPLDAGTLDAAAQLEAVAVLWINNAMSAGSHHAFKML